MNITFNTHSGMSNNKDILLFQGRTVEPFVKRAKLNLSSEKNIINTKDVEAQSLVNKIKNLFGLKPRKNSVIEIKDLKFKIKDTKSEIKITKSQIGEINKHIRYLHERNAFCTKRIEDLKTMDKGPASVFMINVQCANMHIYGAEIEIERNNKEILQLQEQLFQLRNKKKTLNSQLLEIKSKLAK